LWKRDFARARARIALAHGSSVTVVCRGKPSASPLFSRAAAVDVSPPSAFHSGESSSDDSRVNGGAVFRKKFLARGATATSRHRDDVVVVVVVVAGSR